MAPIKVGVAGYGFSTKCFHLPYILPNPDLEIHAFLQRAPAPASPSDDLPKWGHCTVDFPKAKHYRTAEEFFGDAEIELVVVCTSSHEEFVEGALRAGKHVVVEKPFVKTSEKANELIALAKEKSKVLTVFHNRRYDSDFRTLEHLISQDALGSIRDAEIHFDFPSPSWVTSWTAAEYSPGEGMAFGLGTHTVDQAVALFGRPVWVMGHFASNRGVVSDVDDTFTMFLGYGGNLTVTVKTAIVTHMKDQLKFFIRGTEGTYIKFGYCPQEAKAITNPGKPATDPSHGREDPRIWGTLSTTRQIDSSQTLDAESGLYIGKYPSVDGWCRGYYEDVVKAIRGEADVKVTAETARDGLRIIEGARESWVEGRRVTLQWD